MVDSFSPSTGAFFSPISATNATGNFTKIVQRLPLRIKLLENQPDIKLLRPGLSVVVSVDTTKNKFEDASIIKKKRPFTGLFLVSMLDHNYLMNKCI